MIQKWVPYLTLAALGCSILLIWILRPAPASPGVMPWHTGEATLDSLLDAVDRIEWVAEFDHSARLHALVRADSVASLHASEDGVACARVFIKNQMMRLSTSETGMFSADTSELAALNPALYPYLHARLKLQMAAAESDLNRKTDMLFGILPAFIDARDSMRIVETLYELNMDFGRIWDVQTQVEYLHEILQYVPDSIPVLRAIIQSNIIRLDRERTDPQRYLASLDSMRQQRHLMDLAPALGIILYSDLYRLRKNEADLDTAAYYVDRLEVSHNSTRLYMIQRLEQALRHGWVDSARRCASRIAARMADTDDPVDMESMRALIPYYNYVGMAREADSVGRMLAAAERSVDAYGRALKMARMNADRRIADFRRYSEKSHNREKIMSVSTAAGVVLIVVLLPAVYFILWIRRRHRSEDTALKNDLANAKRRLTVAQMRSAERERAISELLSDLDRMDGSLHDDVGQADALRRKLRLQLTGDDEWERFAAVFTEMRPGFVDKLRKSYPQLTRSDIRLCCLLEMDLDTKHMAQLLSIMPESVKKHRQRLRAKLGIDPFTKWPEFFARF